MPFINRWYYSLRNILVSKYPRLYCFCESRKSFVKFLVAGAFSGGTDLVFLFVFHGLMKIDIVVSTTAAFILSFLVSFTLQKFWTFRNYSHDRVPHQLAMYLSTAFVAMNLNGFLMHLLVNRFHIWYILSQIIVNFGIGMVNFLVYKFIIFKDHGDEADSKC